MDKSKKLTDLGLRMAYIVYEENDKGLILVSEPAATSGLYPSIGITIIQKDTGELFHTNLTGNFIENAKHNKRFRNGVCSRLD